MTAWDTLGVSDDIAVADLRRRYAALVKEYRPETHPQDFARIRAAYELALAQARRREAEAAEAAAATAVDEHPTAFDDVPIAVAGGPAAPASLPDPPLAGPAPENAAPDLAVVFHGFLARVAETPAGADEALLPALRRVLQARVHASLDDGQALEFALLRWFIEADSPPLALLFETGRAFDWHHHESRLSPWLPAWAVRRLETLLALSRDRVYARHFSGNARLRRLHGAPGLPMPVAIQTTVLDARAWAERWQQLAETAQAPALASALDAKALRAVKGARLMTTDLLAGVLVAVMTADVPGTIAYAIATTMLALAARLAWLADGGAWQRRGQAAVRAARRHSHWTVGGALLLLGAVVATDVDPTPGTALIVLRSVVLLPFCALGLALGWRLLAGAEGLVAGRLAWREAVARLEFDRWMRTLPSAGETLPFGPRLSWLERLKAITPARRLEAVEIAQRARPPRPPPWPPWFVLRRGGGRWRQAWYALWLLSLVVRFLMHAFR